MKYLLVILVGLFAVSVASADTDSVMGQRKCKIAQTC